MLPISAETLPTTVTELTEGLRRGLAEYGLDVRGLEAQGRAFPKLEKLRIDLSGTRLNRAFRPPKPAGGASQTIEIADFELLGSPIYVENAPAELRLVAEHAQAGLEFADGRGSLIPKGASAGTVTVEITREALESLLHSLAVEAAAKQGLEVRKTSLSFTQEGTRAISFRAEVTAKVFIMTAALALTGRLSIDDQLNARISGLGLAGDAMILKLASSFAKPYLDRLEGREFPLLALAPGDLKLRDVEITAGDALLVGAQFGNG